MLETILMAIVRLPLTKDLTYEGALQIAKTTPGLDGKSRNETYQCLDMVQIWQDWINDTFGVITKINHRSQGDDPPDLELIFEGGRVVGMEHTKLQPQHVGKAEAWLKKSGQGGGLPSISSPPANNDELSNIVAGLTPAWSNVIDDWTTIAKLLVFELREKMSGMPSGGIIGVVCDLFVMDENEHLLVQIASDIVNSVRFSDFANYTLILLSRSNPSKFYSALVKRAEILERRGKPRPLSADEEKSYRELRSEIEAQATLRSLKANGLLAASCQSTRCMEQQINS
jgi:hypothetical protein